MYINKCISVCIKINLTKYIKINPKFGLIEKHSHLYKTSIINVLQ